MTEEDRALIIAAQLTGRLEYVKDSMLPWRIDHHGPNPMVCMDLAEVLIGLKGGFEAWRDYVTSTPF